MSPNSAMSMEARTLSEVRTRYEKADEKIKRSIEAFVPLADLAEVLSSPSTYAADRFPGARDKLFFAHPIVINYRTKWLKYMGVTANLTVLSRYIKPTTEQIRLQFLCRFFFLCAAETDLRRLYCDDAGFDADHSSDELAETVFGFTLQHGLGLFIAISAIDHGFYEAVWTRDWKAVEKFLVRFQAQLPVITFLGRLKNKSLCIKWLLASLFELERGFEIVAKMTSPAHLTRNLIARALDTEVSFEGASKYNYRLARYFDGTRFHHFQRLVREHEGAAYGAAHKCLSAFQLQRTCHHAVPPFAHDPRLRLENGDFSAESHFGFDALRLVISLVLSVANCLPRSAGGKSKNQSRICPPIYYSAVGRVAMIILSNANPNLATSILEATVTRVQSARGRKFSLNALISNTHSWWKLENDKFDHGGTLSATVIESATLGASIFGNIVRNVKKECPNLTSRFKSIRRLNRIDLSLRFRPQCWWQEPRLVEMMRKMLEEACRKDEKLRQLPSEIEDFCIRAAAAIWPSYSPFAQDPVYRL